LGRGSYRDNWKYRNESAKGQGVNIHSTHIYFEINVDLLFQLFLKTWKWGEVLAGGGDLMGYLEISGMVSMLLEQFFGWILKE
jgi:hypothetical protein